MTLKLDTIEKIQAWQKFVGETPDGDYGDSSQANLETELKTEIKSMMEISI